jgi:hypothetical protein
MAVLIAHESRIRAPFWGPSVTVGWMLGLKGWQTGGESISSALSVTHHPVTTCRLATFPVQEVAWMSKSPPGGGASGEDALSNLCEIGSGPDVLTVLLDYPQSRYTSAVGAGESSPCLIAVRIAP